MYGECHFVCLIRIERDACKADQLALRASYRGNLVAIVELYDLVTCTLPGVAYSDRDFDRLRSALCLYDHVFVCKGGIAQAMSEREQGGGWRVNIIAKEHRMITTGSRTGIIAYLAD